MMDHQSQTAESKINQKGRCTHSPHSDWYKSNNVCCRIIRASVDALCRDGAGLISRERVQRGRLTRQGT